MADNDKILVKVSSNPSVKVTDDQTIVREVKVGQPIKRIKQSRFHASSLGGDSSRVALLRDSNGTLVIETDLVPDETLTRNLGSPDKKFHSLYVGGGTVYLGGLAISEDSNGNVTISGVDSAGVVIAGTTKVIATDIDSAVVVRIVEPMIDSAIQAVVGAAPAALDTLVELANALGNDSDAFGTLVTSINAKLDSAQVQDLIDSIYVAGLVGDLVKGVGEDLTDVTASQVIDTFSITDFRTVKYLIQLEHDSDSKYHSAEILLTHNGIDAYLTEYAIVQTDSSLGEFDATVDSGNIKLLLSPSYTNTSFKAKRISVDA